MLLLAASIKRVISVSWGVSTNITAVSPGKYVSFSGSILSVASLRSHQLILPAATKQPVIAVSFVFFESNEVTSIS